MGLYTMRQVQDWRKRDVIVEAVRLVVKKSNKIVYWKRLHTFWFTNEHK